MKKYKYITIKQLDGEVFSGHAVYRIFNNRNDAQLGILSFYKPWKQYVFSSKEDCVFNESCLLDVLDFITNVIKSKN